ncbi:MAG: 1-acyl-sn-glycerol-3-phosphate acyltransferase [Rhodocyclaceae bacterium]|nr:MAG: 1-acyl-sn-glycerol-3-phosphate acyltransferase [Rhodocyclaceae bacterium]
MLRQFLAGIRLVRVGVHLVYGWCLVTALYPLIHRHDKLKLQQGWSISLLDILGLRLAVSAPAALGLEGRISGLVVANHVSWLDVFVISAIRPVTFVCKSEVRRWPLIGTLCEGVGTVFLERGNKAAAMRTVQVLAAKLIQGDGVAVFPEGTTGEGVTLLPFRTALLQAAVDTGVSVQPLAIRYLDANGIHALAANYCGEISFWQSLCSIVSCPDITASVSILEQVPAASRCRKELTEMSHALIRRSLEQVVPRSGTVVRDETHLLDADIRFAGDLRGS